MVDKARKGQYERFGGESGISTTLDQAFDLSTEQVRCDQRQGNEIVIKCSAEMSQEKTPGENKLDL